MMRRASSHPCSGSYILIWQKNSAIAIFVSIKVRLSIDETPPHDNYSR